MKVDQFFDFIFSYYDKLIGNFSPSAQALISIFLLAFLLWQIYMFIKSGHWIFLVVIIFFSPGTWPATKMIGSYIWMLIRFLISRAQIVLY